MSIICPFFGSCGGCSYQDLPTTDYIELKRRFVQSALLHEGIDFPLSEIILIPPHTRRRATFAYTGGVIGFNAMRSHQIIPINACPMLTPKLDAIIQLLQKFVKHLSGSGDIAVLNTEWGIDISVTPQKNKDKHPRQKTQKDPTQDLTFIQNVTDFCHQNGIARFVFNDTLMYQISPLPFPPNVFMQPSAEGEKALMDLVKKACASSHSILDLFCGLGTFTKPLHQMGKKVHGIDITEESIQSLKSQNISAEARDLFRQPMMPSEMDKYDTVILDPARAGAKAQSEQIASSNVATVVMISCNPITFARDCKSLLNAGFKFEWIVPVDQFTFTQHIEVVGLLKR